MTESKISMEEKKEFKMSTSKMISFVSLLFGVTILVNMMQARYTAFYETEVLLPISYMTLAIVFYTIWDMINDPLAGFLTDRKYRFTKRFGKRYPWLMMASFPLVVVMVLFFMPPDPSKGVWATFFWFLITLMCFDGFASVVGVAYNSSLINKFRSDEDRLKASSLQQVFATLGLMVGFLVPPFIVQYGNKSSYVSLAFIFGIIFLITLIASIYGQRENKAEIARYYVIDEKQESFLTSFFKMFKISLRQKNFRAILIITISLSAFNLLFIASIPYYVRYILQADASTEFLLYLPYLLAAAVPIPLYFWISKKYGHLRVYILTFLLKIVVLFLLMVFVSNFIITLILVAVMGVSVGISNIAGIPVVGNFYDEAAVLNKKRQEGIYLGIQSFFGRSMYIFQMVAFWIIHDLTGFQADSSTQTPLAQFGILIHMMLIPAVISLLATLYFWKSWDLKGDKLKSVKEQLKELKI